MTEIAEAGPREPSYGHSEERQGAPVHRQEPSLLEFPATYLLIALNVLLFVAMWQLRPHASSVGPAALPWAQARVWSSGRALLERVLTEPFSERELIRFGACVPLKVLQGGQWWRLVTSTFVHVTLLHLLLNMWCLWNLGIFGERLLGRPGLIAVYLLTGAAGMLQSVLVATALGPRDEITAGASGAVFGLAGILIVLLSNRRLASPWRELRSLRRQVLFFALANLLLGELPAWLPHLLPGMAHSLQMLDLPRVDNNAHLGGLVCGLLLGAPLVPRMTSGRSTYRVRQALVFGSAALVLLLVGYAAVIFVHGR